MRSDCGPLMRPTLRIQSINSNLLNLSRTTNHILFLKSTLPVKSTLRAMRSTIISWMTRLLRTTITILSLQWPHILARVRLFPLLLIATRLHHHRRLSSPEWAVRMVSGLFFRPTALPRLSALRTRILLGTFVAARHILAHTMARWIFPRWIPMLSATNSRCKCRSMRLIMVAWFLIQHFPLHQLHFQGLSTIPGHFYRRAMYLVGDVEAYRTRRRACDRAPVISPFRCLHLFAQVGDYAAVNVRRTCATERDLVRPHVSRVRNLEIRALSYRQAKKLPENPRWAGFNLSHGIMRVSRHAGILAQMTRTRKMQTM